MRTSRKAEQAMITVSQEPMTDEQLEQFLARLGDAPAERVQVLQRLLGDATCRQLGIYPIPAGFKLSVVIPVFNERPWIEELVRRVEAVPIPKEIVIVDDCSTDGTRDVLHRL